MRNITTKRKEATEKKSKTELAKELANNAMKRTRTRWEALELLHKIEEHLMSLVWKQKKYFEESQLRALEEIKNKPKALKQFEKIYAQANQMIENPIKILLAEIYSAKLAIWDTIEVPRYEKRK
jgi:hypothetical protein